MGTNIIDRRVGDLPGPLYRLYTRARFGLPGPKVFANSQPKSGTHLLTAVLANLPDMLHNGTHYSWGRYADRTGTIDWVRLGAALRRVRDGQFVSGHLPGDEQAKRLLAHLGFRVLMIHRDPRDVVVSDVFYMLKRDHHPHHHRFANVLQSFDERLRYSIAGWDADEHGPGRPSIGTRIDHYAPWWEDPGHAYTCRFEELIGPRGGGSVEQQLAHIRGIADYLDRPLRDDQVEQIADRAFSARSATFRKGRIGDWTNHFTDEHRRLFKAVASEQLIRLGYEQDGSW